MSAAIKEQTLMKYIVVILLPNSSSGPGRTYKAWLDPANTESRVTQGVTQGPKRS